MKKKQDESAEDKAIGKMVAERLREQIQPGAMGCPDAETLAAFYDRSLTDEERAVSENHLLTCPRCQECLAELARLSEADEPLVLVEEETAALAEAAPGWHFKLSWAVPFLIVLIGGGIWFREDVRKLFHAPQETAMQSPAPAVPPEATQASPSYPSGEKKEAAKAPARDKLAQNMAPPPLPQPASSMERTTGEAPPMSIVGAATKTREANKPGKMAASTERADLPAAAPPPGSTLRSPAEGKDAQLADRAAAGPARPSSEEAQTSETRARFAKAVPSELRGVTVHGATPTFAPKWRVSRRGVIQKADQAGGWLNVPSGVQADLFDITFADSSAGWVVGHEGTILRSTDGGNTWSKVPSPTSEDLVHVSAESAREAQVISRTGKVFRTADGGRTWKSNNQ